jgi:hypothetical protein
MCYSPNVFFTIQLRSTTFSSKLYIYDPTLIFARLNGGGGIATPRDKSFKYLSHMLSLSLLKKLIANNIIKHLRGQNTRVRDGCHVLSQSDATMGMCHMW